MLHSIYSKKCFSSIFAFNCLQISVEKENNQFFFLCLISERLYIIGTVFENYDTKVIISEANDSLRFYDP